MKKLFFLISFFSTFSVSAQNIAIKDFIVKENLSQNGKLAVIAVDSTEKADDYIKGTFSFSVNGFRQSLLFSDGVAVLQLPIESSTVVFFKHKNQHKEFGKLYYIHKSETGLNPYKLSGLVLVLIPALLLLIAYMFKRFLFTLVILAFVFFYFNVSKGLNVSQIFESFIMGFKSIF